MRRGAKIGRESGSSLWPKWELLSQTRWILSKGEAKLWLNGAHRVHRVAQNCFFYVSGRGDAAGGAVRRFLEHVADVSARPFPMNLVWSCGAIQSFPPGQIRLAAEASAHRFDHVARVGKYFHVAWFAQRFEPDRRGDDLRLLVRRAAKILAENKLDVNTRSFALQNVIWSTAVQHGGATPIVGRALANLSCTTSDPTYDKQLICAIYAERGRKKPDGNLAYFSKSSPNVQAGVAKRFQNEQADALAMLAKET